MKKRPGIMEQNIKIPTKNNNNKKYNINRNKIKNEKERNEMEKSVNNLSLSVR